MESLVKFHCLQQKKKFVFLCRCVFRRSSGSFAASGRRSVRVGRRTTTTAPIRDPTTPPSWTAASRRCPPSAPARDVLPPDSTLHHGPPPRTKSSSQGRWEEASRARCPRLLRTLGRCWTGGASMRRSSMEPQRERYRGKWSTDWHAAASSGHAPTLPLTGSGFKKHSQVSLLTSQDTLLTHWSVVQVWR